MTNYSPITNPGEVHRRTRYIGIRTPLDRRTDAEKANGAPAPMPLIEVLEQDAVRLLEREEVLADLGSLPVSAFNQTNNFPIRDPVTDEPTGQTATEGEAMALIYSWVRAQQLARDAQEAAALAPSEPA